MYPSSEIVERLALDLHPWLKGKFVNEIFSTSKSDLFFSFQDGRCIKIQFFEGLMYFQFPPADTLPKKNKLPQFSQVLDTQVTAIAPHPGSRSFQIHFSNQFSLVFKIFGKFSNCILYNPEQEVESIFCLNHQKDKQLSLADFHKGALETQAVSVKNPLEREAIYLIKNKVKTFELSFVKEAQILDKFDTMILALDAFTRLYLTQLLFDSRKQAHVGELTKRLKFKQKRTKELLYSLENLKNRRSYSELGDLLMANLQSIHKGTGSVEVFDFYNDSKLKIKIDPLLSPQQNAGRYYQKSKNEIIAAEHKHKQLQQLQVEMEALSAQLAEIEEAESMKALKKIETSDLPLRTNEPKQKMALPYREFKIDGYAVWVGKSAKANDELISKYAGKNDLWLHAKDVSGSHVIVKHPGVHSLPMGIIEKSASLAAWYSKAKNSAWVPVVYTQRKFVRKPKGAAPGKVVIEKEKSILVEPGIASENKED